MRKVDDGEKRRKRMAFIVATNVIASRPPERRPTGTLHAKKKFIKKRKPVALSCAMFRSANLFSFFIFCGLDSTDRFVTIGCYPLCALGHHPTMVRMVTRPGKSSGTFWEHKIRVKILL